MANPESTQNNPNRKRRILSPEERQERYIREISKIKKVMFEREFSENDTLLRSTIGPAGVERVRGYSVPARVSDMNDGEYFISGIAYSGQSLLLERHDMWSKETVFVDYNLETNEVKGMRQSVTAEGERTNEALDAKDDELLGMVMFGAHNLCNPQLTTPYEEETEKLKDRKNIYKFQLAELQDMQEPLF